VRGDHIFESKVKSPRAPRDSIEARSVEGVGRTELYSLVCGWARGGDS
jgi:hypothetical protein